MDRNGQKTPKNIVKEALYSKLLGIEPFDLEGDNPVPHDLGELFERYTLHFGHPAGIRSLKDFKKLRQEFAIALRHHEDLYNLCLNVAKQALDKGLPYVMFGVSSDARILKNCCKEVVLEVNRAKSLRFAPHPENHQIIYADYHINHYTADLILKYFNRRFPTKIILLTSRKYGFWIRNNEVSMKNLNEFSISDLDQTSQEEREIPYWKVAR